MTANQVDQGSHRTDAAAPDALDQAVAEALGDVLFGSEVTITRRRAGTASPAPGTVGAASATGPGPAGFDTTITINLEPRVARLLRDGKSALREMLEILPAAGLRAAAELRPVAGDRRRLTASLRRAVRDTVATEILLAYFRDRLGDMDCGDLMAETIEYLVELSGTRVEAHDVTHGVVVADVFADVPRLVLRYPDDLRPAKRAPLLFDGQQSVLLVDPYGRARTELQRHHLDRHGGQFEQRRSTEGWLDSGSLVGLATRAHGGIGFYLRSDRSIWTFVDGQPLLVRRGEHWTAFPVELAASISHMIGGGPAAAIAARAAYMISARPDGAIIAIVDDLATLDGVVPAKDRYDLRYELDRDAMRPETRLHHLIDAEDLDEYTLARLAGLDGATVLDRQGRLIAYAAIVTTSDSEHEGARTAAARTLSQTALVSIKVSVDGDITIFQDGAAVTTLLGHPTHGRQ